MKLNSKLLLSPLFLIAIGLIAWLIPTIRVEYYFYKIKTDDNYFLDTVLDSNNPSKQSALEKFLDTREGKTTLFKQLLIISNKYIPDGMKMLFTSSEGFLTIADGRPAVSFLGASNIIDGFQDDSRNELLLKLTLYTEKIYNAVFQISGYQIYVTSGSINEDETYIVSFYVKGTRRISSNDEDETLRDLIHRALDKYEIHGEFLGELLGKKLRSNESN